MSRVHAWFVVPSLIVAGALFPAGGRVAVAGDADPTVFQQAIRSWMGVVALLAEDVDEAEADERRADDDEGEERGEEGERAHRGHRNGRHRDHDHAEHREHERGAGREHHGREAPEGRHHHGMHAEGHGDQPRMSPGMRREPQAVLGEIVERLSRIERKLDARPGMGNPWSPRPQGGRDRGGRPPLPEEGRREMEERMQAMMQQGRARVEQARAKMEQARQKFREMEERIEKLEAEVERLKAGR